MHKIRKKEYGFWLIVFLYSSILDCYSQGLLFSGNEKRIDEKASYSVFQDKNSPLFSEELRISFDYSIRDIKSSGYIFSVADKETGKIFSLNYLSGGDDTCTYSFNEEGYKAFYSCTLHRDSIDRLWMPISVTLYLQTGEAEIAIGKHRQRVSGLDINKKTISPSIYFGKYEYILDQASFALRNLSIADSKKVWNVPLDESEGNEVHDDKGNVIGWVDNPVWLINQAYYWKKLFSQVSNSPAGINFDRQKQQILLFNQDSLAVYDFSAGQLSTLPYVNRLSVSLFLGMSFLDEPGNKMYVYEINNIGGPTVASLNRSDLKWTTVSSLYLQQQYHHHAGCFIPEKESYILFGGYGSRRYSNAFLEYDISQDRWSTLHLSGDTIDPRYFSGMAVSADYKRLYIYGGMGNESGDQNIGRNYYYDLHLVDLEEQHVRKLWTQEAPDINRVPARNMILTDDEKFLYMLCYPEYMSKSDLQLYRVSVADGSCEAVGNTIPIVSEEIATNANLFVNPSTGEFYCSVQEFDGDGEVSTSVYSLAAPPVTLEQVKHYSHLSSVASGRWMRWWWILPVAFFPILLLWRGKRRKRADALLKQPAHSSVAGVSELVGYEELRLVSGKESDLIPDTSVALKNAIFLFGNFTVIGCSGRDITYLFSPKLRTIFIYILLQSILKDGVLSSDMNELFWGDKSDDKAKNLKGVTMNNIRKILQDVDGVELAYQKGYFKLLISKECYCDYLSYKTLIGREEKSELDAHCISELIKILSRGKFLYAMESELFDYFKQKAEDFILVFLPHQLDKAYRLCKYDTVLRLCNILFSVDVLSELALKYYVCTYQKMSRPDKAIKRYHAFVKDYEREMDESYEFAYESISL